MFNFRDISIKNKLVFMQVFTSVIVLSLCFAAFVLYHIKDYRERKANSMISLAQVIGTNSISAIQFQDNEVAKNILSDLRKVTPEVINACILDADNKVFAKYNVSKASTIDFTKQFVKGQQTKLMDKYLLVYNPIVNGKEILGTVCLRVELSELDTIIKTQYTIALILLVVGVALAFLLAFVMQRYISTRLLSLVKFMNHVGATGNYKNHFVSDGGDEISTLATVFNNLLDQVTESQQKKDEFIGIASHELKTPLTSIKAYLQVVDKRESDERNKLYLQKSLENVRKLESLIYDLLDVSKIQSGQLVLNMTDIDVDALIDETIAAFQIVSQQHTIVREGLPLKTIITADKQRIEQVLINLLSNATKYSPDAKQVIVSTTKTNQELIIKVQDFGIGIAKDEQDKVFDRFYRTKEMTGHISGFGLGLYICNDIIRRHNGNIWIESETGNTAFYVSLPLKATKSTKTEELSTLITLQL